MHTAYAHHTQKDDAHTHRDATAYTQRPCFSPTSTQYYTYHTHHTLSTNMQTPDTFPHPATPTLTHSYNTHITKTTATHPHTFPFSLSCSRSWRELCQLRRRDSTSRACFYKREVPHQLWPPPWEGTRGEFQICILAWGKGCGVIFLPPSDCQITHLPRPRDHFSKQWYRWGWLFFPKFHTALMNAICVSDNRPFSLGSRPCRGW